MKNYKYIRFGQLNKDFTYEDYQLLIKLNRLANKHQKQAENSCNGQGVVKGKIYYNGLSYGQKPGEYEKREYGYNVRSAYLSADDEETIFDREMDNIIEKINNLIEGTNFKIETQGDPRGQTVKIFYNKQYINF